MIVRTRNYLDWLRDQPCAVTGAFYPEGGREPAHTFKSTGGGGIGLKSTDKYALPLSNAQHALQSGMSEMKYWRDVLINRPLLRGRMILCYSVIHEERRPADPKWLDDIRTDNTLVKHLVQSFAEIRYYNAFLKETAS
jgi:hypothetical protein